MILQVPEHAESLKMTKIESVPTFYPAILKLKSLTKAEVRIIVFPTPLRNTIYNKVLSIYFTYKKLAASTSDNYGKALEATFDNLKPETDIADLLIGPNLSAAIKKTKRNEEATHSMQQYVFFYPIKWVVEEAHKSFTPEELRTLSKMLQSTPRFHKNHSKTSRQSKPSIQDRYPNLPYTNKDYVNSIREISFVFYNIWERVRSAFKKDSRLLEILKNNREWIFPLLMNANLGRGSGGLRKLSKKNINAAKITGECTHLMISAALKIDDPIFIEALFMDLALKCSYSGKLRLVFTEGETVKISPHVTLDYMKGFLMRLYRKKNTMYTNGRVFKKRQKNNNYARITSGEIGTFTPYALFFPYGKDELQLYSAMVSTDRHQLSNQKYIQPEDIVLSNSHNEEVSDSTFSKKLKLITKKYRNDRCEGDPHPKGSGMYKVLLGLKKQFTWAYEEGLIPDEYRYIFLSLFDDCGEAVITSGTFYTQNFLSFSRYSEKIRTHSMLIVGTIANRIIHNNIEHDAALTIMTLAATRMGEKFSSQVFTVNEITQSRMGLEAAEDLNYYKKSIDMNFSYSEGLTEKLKIQAPMQHHNLTTRLNVYYLKSTDKVRVGKLYAFAAEVGEEMMKMAEAIALKKSQTSELITTQQAREICGLAENEYEFTADELMLHAQAQGSLLNETGFISQETKTYIIKSPLHAELIGRKIDHIDNQIEKLLQNNHKLVPNAIAQRMLLAVMLSNFDEAMKREGKKKYGHANFSFPDLTATLGGF